MARNYYSLEPDYEVDEAFEIYTLRDKNGRKLRERHQIHSFLIILKNLYAKYLLNEDILSKDCHVNATFEIKVTHLCARCDLSYTTIAKFTEYLQELNYSLQLREQMYTINCPKIFKSLKFGNREDIRLDNTRTYYIRQEKKVNSADIKSNNSQTATQSGGIILDDNMKSVKLGRRPDNTLGFICNEDFDIVSHFESKFPNNRKIKKELKKLTDLAISRLNDDESNISDFGYFFLYNNLKGSFYN